MLIAQKIYSIPHLALEIKEIAKLLFWVIWTGLAMPTKINGINLQESLMFISKQNINFIPSFFFDMKYCKYITNLQFWVFQACLAMNSKIDTDSLRKLCCLSSYNKIIFIPPLFPETLQRYCKLVILRILGTSGHAYQKQQHQLVGYSDAYLQTKKQIFQKMQNILFLGPFGPNLGKIKFSIKSGSLTFQNLQSPNFIQKNQKKLRSQS